MYVNNESVGLEWSCLSSIKWYETTFRSTHVREYQSVGLEWSCLSSIKWYETTIRSVLQYGQLVSNGHVCPSIKWYETTFRSTHVREYESVVSNGHVCRVSNGMRLLFGVLMYVNISQLVYRLSNGMRLLLGVLMYVIINHGMRHF